MPIKLTPTTSLNLFAVKKNFSKIADEAMSVQQPTNASFVTSVPSTADLAEQQAVFYVSGATYRIYYKINGVIKYATLT